jgi:hypothetical protein
MIPRLLDSARPSSALTRSRVACDYVTREEDLDPRAASQHGELGAERPKIRSEELEVNRFVGWKPLKKFAAILDRPVRGTPVETIVSDDRDR